MVTIDGRGMQPPRPFEMVMDALCQLEPGESMLVLLDREPIPLYRVLQRNGYRHHATKFDDGHFEIEITQPAQAARPADAIDDIDAD